MAATTTPGLASQTGSFSCITCHMLFTDGAAQRDHYKAEVHRFNLKRKVAGLAPVTADVYDAKQKAIQAAEKAKQEEVAVVAECTTCNKKFHSDAQLTQHLETKKHKLQEAKGPVSKPARGSETSSLASSVDSSAAPSVPALTEEQLMSMTDEEIYDYRLKTCRKFDLTDCLFCKHSSPTLKANLRHMSIDHSFYIPDIEYLVDLEGLIKYLGEKISVGWVCLNCNGSGKTFHSCEAVQDHMRSLGHCKLAYDDEEQEEEFADFYDFTEYYKAKGIDPEKGPEDLTTNEFGELILSDSTVIGHRELKHIYKQQAAGIRRHESALIQSLVSEYRALALKKDQVAKLPPSKDARRNRDMALRVGTQANRLVRLRFRSDCPI